MIDLASLLGAVQNGGGLLLLLMYLVFELRSMRRDFAKHEEIYIHEPKGVHHGES